MMMDQAIELVAEAIWSAGWDGVGREKPDNVQWADVRVEVKDKYRAMAWAATNMVIEILRQEEAEKLDRCDPAKGVHSNPHRGCILR